MAFPRSLPAAPVFCWAILADAIATYVRLQMRQRRPGGATVRLLGGQLSPLDYDVLPPPTRTGGGSGEGHPRRHPPDSLYSLAVPGVLERWLTPGVGFNLVGLDRDMADGLCRACRNILGVQGNVDPGCLFCTPEAIRGPGGRHGGSKARGRRPILKPRHGILRATRRECPGVSLKGRQNA